MGEAIIAGQISTVVQNVSSSDTPFIRQLFGASFTILGNYSNKTANASISVNNSFQTFNEFGISYIREIRYSLTSSDVSTLMSITIPSSGSSSANIDIAGTLKYGSVYGTMSYVVTVKLAKNDFGYTISVSAPSTATYNSSNMSVSSFSKEVALWISII